MDVVLRTPNGEAEISVGPGQEDVLLADVVERVTGRAGGAVVYVDGRAVPSATSLGTSGVLTGSVISTTDDALDVPDDGRVELVQLAGVGAGARTWLRSGRYRVGVGRRMSATELDHAPVDQPMLELDVDSSGAVRLRSTGARSTLDGDVLPAERSTPWPSGLVEVAGRVFSLGRRDPRDGMRTGHRFGGVGVDGTAAFNRPPRIAPAPLPPPLAVPDGASSRRSDRRRDGPVSRPDRHTVAEFRDAVLVRHRDDLARQRGAHPDIAAAVELADSVSPELWQRRPGHPDVFQFPIGLADLPWTPPLARGQHALANAQTIVEDVGPLPLVPVTVDLLAERGLGVVGGSEFARALVRGLLVEAAVTHGPADLDIVILSSADRASAWEWTKWLPQLRVGGAARIYSTEDQVVGWATAARRGWDRPGRPAAPTHLTLVVVDEPRWWRDRAAPLRPLFSDASMPLRFVVMTRESADVPAVCTTVVSALPDHGATVDFLMDRRRVDRLHGFLVSESLALAAARRLAPLDDPDVPMAEEAALPESVALLSLLQLDDPTPREIASRWASDAGGTLSATIGVSERGPFAVDLVVDGPHGLVVGTSGSATAEFLRTLAVSLAAEHPPDDVNFVLVGATGGSPFGSCVDLPHVVGVVTDLDEHVANRVLRALRAELRHREGRLAAAGASSLADLRGVPDQPPLPRLVLLVDELVAEPVDRFVTALVELAERGRNLGLHLVLATQRPTGLIDEQVRAHTNLRIAMRVQDEGDSLDIIGTKDAARLSRRLSGRAYARVAAGTPTLFQLAGPDGIASASHGGHGVAGDVDLEPYVISREPTPMENRLARLADASTAEGGVASDVDRLVTAIIDAADQVGQSEQRRPWPDPLPVHLPPDDVPVADAPADPGGTIPLGLADLPDEQRQAAIWWNPASDGALLVHGPTGSGCSSLLIAVSLGIADRHDPDDVHLYFIDADVGALAPLADLPHVGAVVGADEPDRIARLVAHLVRVVDTRQQASTGAPDSGIPTVIVMVDDVGALRQLLDTRPELDGVGADLERVLRDGPAVGVVGVLTAKEEQAVPASWTTLIPNRLAMRRGESSGSEFGPGRAVRLPDRSEVQLVAPPAVLADAVAGVRADRASTLSVPRIEPLPTVVTVGAVGRAAHASDTAVAIPVGLDTRTAEPGLLVVPFGETAFVAGPSGSGRSSLLVAVADAFGRVAPDVVRFAVAPRGGPLAVLAGLDRPDEPVDVGPWVDRIADTPGRRLVLVDDADRLGGPSFERLAAMRDDGLIVVVAGRADDLRVPGHWTKPLQRFRHGVLLRPGPADGDLVRVSLGGRPPSGAHHGVLVVAGVQTPLLAAVAEQALDTDDDDTGEGSDVGAG